MLSDAVLETFVDGLGALYAFVFHYMPIGRASLERMMTAEQRMRLYERTWSLIRERHLFVVDFWNGATGSNGCLAGGRPGGYFHVNWNGDVSPCVFFPCSPVNVRDVYAPRRHRSTTCGRTPSSRPSGAGSASTATASRTSACGETAGTGSRPASSATTTRTSGGPWSPTTASVRPTRTRGRRRRTRRGTRGWSSSTGEFQALADPVWERVYLRSPGVPPGPMRRY